MGDIMNLERFDWFNIKSVVPAWEISFQVLNKFLFRHLIVFFHTSSSSNTCMRQ